MGGSAPFITILHGGSAQFITILQLEGGGGGLPDLLQYYMGGGRACSSLSLGGFGHHGI